MREIRRGERPEGSNVGIESFESRVAWRETVTFSPVLKERAMQVAEIIRRDPSVVIMGGPNIPTTVYHMKQSSPVQYGEYSRKDRNRNTA